MLVGMYRVCMFGEGGGLLGYLLILRAASFHVLAVAAKQNHIPNFVNMFKHFGGPAFSYGVGAQHMSRYVEGHFILACQEMPK